MIASLYIDVSLLKPTFVTHESLTIEVEGLHKGDNGSLGMVFWAKGVEPTQLQETLERDETVEEVVKIMTTSQKTLFRTYHSSDVPITSVYSAGIEHDVILLAATSEGDGWNIRISIPDRMKLSSFLEYCQGLGIEANVKTIRCSENVSQDGFGLTPSQREVIALAWNRGYFSVPRGTCLADIAAELDISEQAASERLRRGLEELVSNTVCENDALAECDKN